MTRTYALHGLLVHGGLTFREIVQYTGWSERIAGRALQRLLGWKMVRGQGSRQVGAWRRRVYVLA